MVLKVFEVKASCSQVACSCAFSISRYGRHPNPNPIHSNPLIWEGLSHPISKYESCRRICIPIRGIAGFLCRFDSRIHIGGRLNPNIGGVILYRWAFPVFMAFERNPLESD